MKSDCLERAACRVWRARLPIATAVALSVLLSVLGGWGLLAALGLLALVLYAAGYGVRITRPSPQKEDDHHNHKENPCNSP